MKPDFELLESRFNIWAILLSVIRTPKERRAVELWLDGSDNYEIARALQTGDLDVPTARRIAKQFKDRIIKRLSRYVRSAHNG